VKSNVLSHNKKNATLLWDLSEKLTGVKYWLKANRTKIL
jgi:hypothetical protein